ncbi:CCHC-type domain-containing protein [Heracleum sosnowskyi]|uniref:CCHC-type domain-containing protein n=1 Tax=Heracleum sosnowskyi TaxID=360622 RepID=A0AAD8N0Y3_9APIA|nr:CCHC-type domain-containing protein [Heracleum sosnowskyi]
MADNYPEGKSDYRAPLLTGTNNYYWWKGSMKNHLSRDPLVWRVLQKGPYIFLDKYSKPKDVDDLTPDELVKVGYNGKTINSLMNGLNQAEYDKVSSLESAKEMWDSLENYHEGSKTLKKVKLSKLMNEFGNFKLKEGETIRESQARFQVTINSLERLGKKIPREEINMKVLSAVPFIYEAKVTSLESSPLIDTMDHLAVFAELEQFESKINKSQMKSSSTKAPVTKMKNVALQSKDSKPTESDDDSDEEVALISRKIKKLIEAKNRLKRDKGGFSNSKKSSKNSKEQTCFECGKTGHYKRDCYKLKSKQHAGYKDKRSKALLSDDDSDSSEETVNLALVGLENESTPGNSEGAYAETDSEDDESEEPKSVTIEEYMALKAEISKLSEKNACMSNIIQDLMPKMKEWDATSSNKATEIKELMAKNSQSDAIIKVLQKRNKVLTEEIKELRSDNKAKAVALESYKLMKSNQTESSKTGEMASQQAETISQQAEVIITLEKKVKDPKQGMGSFIQGEEGLKALMKNTNAPLVREGVGMNFNKKDKAIKYEGRYGIPYNYAMPWKTCNKCGGKGHLERNCTSQVNHKRKAAYQNETYRQKPAYQQGFGRQ